MVRPKRTDKYAAVNIDGASDIQIEGVSFYSESGTAINVRDSTRINIEGVAAIGATGGLDIRRTHGGRFKFEIVRATGSVSVEHIRDQIDEELDGAKISHSEKESIRQQVNEIFDEREDRLIKEKSERLLENSSNLATVLTLTFNVVQGILSCF